jgi:hypothetical protein
MAELEETFDPSQEESQNGKFDLIPINTEAPMMAVGSEMKSKADNPNGSKWIEWDIQIVDGPFENRHIFHKTTFKNPNEVAERIGRGQLKDLCTACGKGAIRDTGELHTVVFWGKVGIDKGSNGHPDRNKLIGVWAIDGDGNPVGKKKETAPAAAASARVAAPATPKPPPPPPPAKLVAALTPTGNNKPAWANKGAGATAAPRDHVPI